MTEATRVEEVTLTTKKSPTVVPQGRKTGVVTTVPTKTIDITTTTTSVKSDIRYISLMAQVIQNDSASLYAHQQHSRDMQSRLLSDIEKTAGGDDIELLRTILTKMITDDALELEKHQAHSRLMRDRLLTLIVDK